MRVILIAMLIIGIAYSKPIKTQNELSPKQLLILKNFKLGMISKSLYQEFWSEFKTKPNLKVLQSSYNLISNLSIESWKSALLTLENGKIVYTKEYKLKKDNLIKILNKNKSIENVIKNTEIILYSTLYGMSIKIGDEDVYITKEFIQNTIEDLELTQKRVNILLNDKYALNQKEYNHKKYRLIDHPFYINSSYDIYINDTKIPVESLSSDEIDGNIYSVISLVNQSSIPIKDILSSLYEKSFFQNINTINSIKVKGSKEAFVSSGNIQIKRSNFFGSISTIKTDSNNIFIVSVYSNSTKDTLSLLKLFIKKINLK
jgi:hypothetical protein